MSLVVSGLQWRFVDGLKCKKIGEKYYRTCIKQVTIDDV